MTQDTQTPQQLTVWAGSAPAICLLCGADLGKTLKSLVEHANQVHPGELHASMTEPEQTPQPPQGPEIKNAGKWVVGPEPQTVAVLITPDGYVELKEDSGIAFYNRSEALKGARILDAQQQRIEALEAELAKKTDNRDHWMNEALVRGDKLVVTQFRVEALEAALRGAKAVVASLLYGSRMLPASYYRQQQALARRIGVDEDSPRVAALLSPSEAI